MNGLFHLLFGIGAVSYFLYLYIDAHNEVLTWQRRLPLLSEEVRRLQEENLRLRSEAAEAWTPQRLWKLARRPEFGYLQFPQSSEVIIIEASNP